MMIILTLFTALVGTLLSFAAILVQFIGTSQQTLTTIANYQLTILSIACLLACITVYTKTRTGFNRKDLIRRFFTDMPGWLMFALLLLITTAILGDLSVLLARLGGHEITSLFHLPSVCIISYCVIFRLVYWVLDSN